MNLGCITYFGQRGCFVKCNFRRNRVELKAEFMAAKRRKRGGRKTWRGDASAPREATLIAAMNLDKKEIHGYHYFLECPLSNVPFFIAGIFDEFNNGHLNS